MFTCYVLDDEYHAIEVLSGYINNTSGLSLIGSSVDTTKALDDIISERPPDITFVDVEMPQISGIEFSGLVNPYTSVVITTAFPGYALQAFENEVLDYLLKPINYERFLRSVLKIKKSVHTKNDKTRNPAKEHFFIKTDIKGKMIRINYGDINYIEDCYFC